MGSHPSTLRKLSTSSSTPNDRPVGVLKRDEFGNSTYTPTPADSTDWKPLHKMNAEELAEFRRWDRQRLMGLGVPNMTGSSGDAILRTPFVSELPKHGAVETLKVDAEGREYYEPER